MGDTLKHLPDGQDFFDTSKGGDHFGQMKDFGFGPSIAGYEKHQAAPPFAADEPDHGPGGPQPYANGGARMGHMHPHGHHVVHVQHHPDGKVVHHHAHGGFTVHHADGHISHHAHGGAEVGHEANMAHGAHHMAHGGTHPHGHQVMHTSEHDGMHIEHHAHGGYSVHHPDGQVTHHDAHGGVCHAHGGMHYAHGGEHDDEAQDKAMIAKGIHEHEDHEHHGEHTDLHLARGGGARLPRSMTPKAAHMKSPVGKGMPVNKPPRNPNVTRTAPDEMPGGQMGYGVQPSDETGGPPMGGVTAMRKGGMHKR